MKKSMIAVCLLAGFSAQGFSATIPKTRQSEIRLGYGIDPDLERPRSESCVVFDPDDVSHVDGGKHGQKSPATSDDVMLSTDLITSSRQVDEYTRTSVSASVQYLAASGSFSMNSSSQYNLASDQLALGIKAQADYGRWYLNKARLKPEMKELAKRDKKAFYKKCGTEYVSGYRMGQAIHVLMSTFSQSEFSKNTFDFNSSVGASYSGASAAVSSAFASAAASLMKYGSLQIRVSGIGVGELGDFSGVITTERDVAKFSEEIARRVAALGASKAAITHFITSRYEDVDNDEYFDMLYSTRRETLLDLFSHFRKVSDELGRLRKASQMELENQYAELCKYEGPMTCAKYVQYVEQQISRNERAIDVINEAARRCVATIDIKDCKTPSIYDLNPTLGKTIWPEFFVMKLYEAKLKARARE